MNGSNILKVQRIINLQRLKISFEPSYFTHNTNNYEHLQANTLLVIEQMQ